MPGVELESGDRSGLPADAVVFGEAAPGARVAGLVRAMRPRQWVKNLACFAGLIFSKQLFQSGAEIGAMLAFAGFCMASSAVYLINDVMDRRKDREHPLKRARPIASGLVPVSWAIGAAGVLVLAAAAFTAPLPSACWLVLGLYLAMQVAYSLRLKHTVLLDVMLIALGFVLRVLHGVYAVAVLPSPWIILCMFFLALFLGYAKRRSELARVEAGVDGFGRRPVLEKYRTVYLDYLLVMTATMAILSYALYTVHGRDGDASLIVTVPLVFYGVIRYLLLVTVHGAGEEPDSELFDPVTLLIVVSWVGLCVAVLYGPLRLPMLPV